MDVGKTDQNREALPPGHGDPPREVMSKLQCQLEKIQQDIQVHQRQTQRPQGRQHSTGRYRHDSRRPSDSGRHLSRAGSSSSSGHGARPYPRPGTRPRGAAPAAADVGGKPYLGQVGALRGPLQTWPGIRPVRMPDPRSRGWRGDRMPQPNRMPRFSSSNGQPRDSYHGGNNQSISWAAPQGNGKPGAGHLQVFPPLVNPHAGHLNALGRVVPPDTRHAPNAWHRSAMGDHSSQPFDGSNMAVVPQRFGPPANQKAPGCQRNATETHHDPNNKSFPQPEGASSFPCNNGNANNSSLHPRESRAGENWPQRKVGARGERSAGDTTTPKQLGESAALDIRHSSPPRKDRSSSGPQTPPGLRSGSGFGFDLQSPSSCSMHSLLLANIPLELASDRRGSDAVFDVHSSEEKTMAPLHIGENTGKEQARREHTRDAYITISDMVSFTHAKAEKSDTNSTLSIHDAKASLHVVSDTAEKLSQKDQDKLPGTLEVLTEDFSHQQVGGEPNSIVDINELGRQELDALDPRLSDKLQRDANNNVPDKTEIQLQQPLLPPEQQPKDDTLSKSYRNPRGGNSENDNTSRSEPPVVFASPLSQPAYQKKAGPAKGPNKAVDLATSLTPRDTNCPRCHERLRWPHLLVCCHRFCFRCLVAMYDTANSRIQCPYCRCVTPAEKSLASLALDLHRCREMCTIQISPFICTICSEDKHAGVTCTTCPGFLCADCQTKHRTMPDWSSHNLSIVSKVGYDENGELHPMCSDHPGMLYSQFCVDCRVMVCQGCLKELHAAHKVCDLAAGREIAEKKFKEMNLGLTNMVELCQKKLQNYNLSKQRVETTVKVVRNNIHKTCNQWLSYIEMFEKISKALADKSHDAGIKHVTRLIQKADEYEKERVTFETLSKQYIDDSEPGELAAMLPLFSQAFERLADFYSNSTLVDPNFSVDLKFDPVYPEFNEAVSRVFSGLRFDHNVTLESLMSSPLGERAVLESAQPQPYELVRRPGPEPPSGNTGWDGDARSESSTGSAASCDPLPDFIRQTTPCKYIFGKYGRGEYEFAEPSGVCYLHDNSLAVCDAKNHRIVIYSDDGEYIKTIGQPTNLPPLPSSQSAQDDHSFSRMHGALYFPFRLAQCPVTRNLVVVERPPSIDIQVFNLEGAFVRSFGHGCLKYPRGVAVDESGKILVVESRTMKVFIFSMEGVRLQQFYLSMHLEFPNDIAARAGSIYVSDNRTHCVHVYDYNLEWQRQIGNESLTYFPIGVALDHAGHVVVADNHNTFNITVFRPDGSFVGGFKSDSKHANCYSVAVHPQRSELVVTTKECTVVIFHFST